MAVYFSLKCERCTEKDLIIIEDEITGRKKRSNMNRKEISNMMRGHLPENVGFWAWQLPNGLIKIDNLDTGLRQSLLANSTKYIFGKDVFGE